MSSRCGMQDYAAEFMYLQVGQRCEAVLKFFTKTKKKQKNKKKMLFFCQLEKATAVKVFLKKILPERWRFFSKNPEGLTLTD